MTDQQKRWAAAGRAVKAARLAKGMSRAELTRVSGVSDVTLLQLEQGPFTKRSDRTLSKVALALNWPQDAFTRLLAGEDPATFVTPESSVIAAIEADPLLNEVARRILIGAYQQAIRN